MRSSATAVGSRAAPRLVAVRLLYSARRRAPALTSIRDPVLNTFEYTLLSYRPDSTVFNITVITASTPRTGRRSGIGYVRVTFSRP